jgi:hypothetical protein
LIVAIIAEFEHSNITEPMLLATTGINSTINISPGRAALSTLFRIIRTTPGYYSGPRAATVIMESFDSESTPRVFVAAVKFGDATRPGIARSS